MKLMETMGQYGHEKVLFVNNEEAGLKAIIAVHNTNLGPAIGGCRVWPYESEEDALFDVIRLSRGMSHKNAAAGLNFGGGKAVIMADPSQKTPEMFKAFAEAVNALGGCYITAEDVNTDTDDAMIIAKYTDHICGLPTVSGDPSPFTAIGVYQGMKGAAKVAFGSDDLKGRTVAVQGLGKVGYDLCRLLHEEGAKLIIANRSNKERLEKAVKEFDAVAVPSSEIISQECDIFAPCALGAVINPETLPTLKCKLIAGAANNVLLDEATGEALKAKGIYYAPDFIINAGGVINAAGEAAGAYDKDDVMKKVNNIYNTIEQILRQSDETGKPEGILATEFAEARIYGNK